MRLFRQHRGRLWQLFLAICLVPTLCSADERKSEPQSATAPASRTEERAFLASDGSTEKYVLVYPPGFKAGQTVSLLIALHGHGSDRWQFVKNQRDECRAVRDVASKHKMLLLSPDYRGTTSWMGPRAEADLVELIGKLRSRFQIDRIIISGGSMGGTAALTFAALHADLIQGVVSLNGTANLVEYKQFGEAIAKSFGGTREEVPQEYQKRSAELSPEKFMMPVATTTGGVDRTVPPDSVLRLVARIRKHNPNVLSIHRKSGGHQTNYEDTHSAVEFVVNHAKSIPNQSQKPDARLFQNPVAARQRSLSCRAKHRRQRVLK